MRLTSRRRSTPPTGLVGRPWSRQARRKMPLSIVRTVFFVRALALSWERQTPIACGVTCSIGVPAKNGRIRLRTDWR